MSLITIEAVFEDGVLKPKQPLDLAPGASVRVTVETVPEVVDPLEGVIGTCKTGPDFSLAERHDEIRYGVKPRPPE